MCKECLNRYLTMKDAGNRPRIIVIILVQDMSILIPDRDVVSVHKAEVEVKVEAEVEAPTEAEAEAEVGRIIIVVRENRKIVFVEK